jgi:hypothetical protein
MVASGQQRKGQQSGGNAGRDTVVDTIVVEYTVVAETGEWPGSAAHGMVIYQEGG